MATPPNLSALIEAKLAALAASQAQVTTAYEYEKNFDEWWTALGREVFQASLGPLPLDRHQKKSSLPNSVPSPLPSSTS